MARALVLWCLFCLWDQSFGLTYNYAEILSKSIWFYEAQRSGKLPANNRVPWRGDSALDDGKDVGLDLTGGYYDAGDHVKFGFPMACVATVLSWGVLEFPDGYTKAGEMDNVLESLRWAFDYFIKCHPSKYEFYGQVGNGHTDHSFWGRPEEMNMYRPAYKITQHAPGSELAGETAAAMAAGYLVFRSRDSAYAHTLLSHARDLYDFAVEYQGDYSDSITNARDFYRSWNGYRDELAWGAAWLLRATGEARYRNYNDLHYESSTNGFGWDDKNAGVQLLMYITTQEEKYRNDVMRTVNSWMPGGNVIYTPKGLAWLNEWGSLRHAANLAAIAMIAANHGVRTNEYRDWADTQMNYILGSTGRSFVCGYGVNPPVQPHHRAASCNDLPAPCGQADESKSGPNPQILHGALVGGPDRYDNYVDIRSDYKANEVATDYNAGFQTALAAFVSIKQ